MHFLGNRMTLRAAKLAVPYKGEMHFLTDSFNTGGKRKGYKVDGGKWREVRNQILLAKCIF